MTKHQEKEKEILQLAKKKGVRMRDADPAFVKKTQAFIEQDMKTLVDYFATKHGAKRSDEMIKRFRPILAKFK